MVYEWQHDVTDRKLRVNATWIDVGKGGRGERNRDDVEGWVGERYARGRGGDRIGKND